MKKVVLVCGGIAGLISSFWSVVGQRFTDNNMSMNMQLFFGYASMLLAFSLIFVGVKRYRDNYNGGVITFSEAFKISLLITVVASIVYTTAWMITYYVFMPNFAEKYVEAIRKELVASGASKAEIEQQMAGMVAYAQKYKNPFFNAMMTCCEILPVGIGISLIASLILKNNPKPLTDIK